MVKKEEKSQFKDLFYNKSNQGTSNDASSSSNSSVTIEQSRKSRLTAKSHITVSSSDSSSKYSGSEVSGSSSSVA